jgi:hypothetical protein
MHSTLSQLNEIIVLFCFVEFFFCSVFQEDAEEKSLPPIFSSAQNTFQVCSVSKVSKYCSFDV